MPNEYHTPVLTQEVIKYLRTTPDGVYVDGTLGGGGHAEQILMNISDRGRVIAFDFDGEAIQYTEQRLARFGDRITFIHDSYANARVRLQHLGIEKIRGLLLDLGVASHQLDEQGRGFGFQREGRLDMRMNLDEKLDAWTVVNTYTQDRLSDLIRKYGEERYARRVARTIVQHRTDKPLNSTSELVEVIKEAVGSRMAIKSMARVFQAIRIEVNHELESLKALLKDTIDLIESGGRIVVISYHSLEDRIVKHFFRDEAQRLTRSESKLIPDLPRQPRLRILTSRPLRASAEEIMKNSRSRSAKLRAAEWI